MQDLLQVKVCVPSNSIESQEPGASYSTGLKFKTVSFSVFAAHGVYL